MNIGQRIKQERIRLGLSQEYVANIIGSTKQAVYKYECGIVTNIPTDKISKMATLFGVTPAYLMGWDEKEKKPTLEDELSEKNVVFIGRDGSVKHKRLTPEMIAMLEQLPESDDNL